METTHSQVPDWNSVPEFDSWFSQHFPQSSNELWLKNMKLHDFKPKQTPPAAVLMTVERPVLQLSYLILLHTYLGMAETTRQVAVTNTLGSQ